MPCHVRAVDAQSLNLMELAEHLLIDKSNTSRTVKKLVELGLVKSGKLKTDNRQKLFSLTSNGKKALGNTVRLANKQVENALTTLDEKQQATVIRGLQLYANALQKGRLQSNYTIRLIQKQDNVQVARVIRDVLTEFGAVGEGYSINDVEIDDMSWNYRHKSTVITWSRIKTSWSDEAALGRWRAVQIHLRISKNVFSSGDPWPRTGQRLLVTLIDDARQRGYKKCYLETLDRMWRANALYQKNGFDCWKSHLVKPATAVVIDGMCWSCDGFFSRLVRRSPKPCGP